MTDVKNTKGFAPATVGTGPEACPTATKGETVSDTDSSRSARNGQPQGEASDEPCRDRSITPRRPTRDDLTPSECSAGEYAEFCKWHDRVHITEMYEVLDDALFIDTDLLLTATEMYLEPSRIFDEPWWMDLAEEYGGSMWVDDFAGSTYRDTQGHLWIDVERVIEFLKQACYEDWNVAAGLMWEIVHRGYAYVHHTEREKASNPQWWFRLHWSNILDHWRHGLDQYRDNFKPDGYVYVLGGEGFYKIGKAKNADTRIKQLAIQLPWPVEVEHVIPCRDYSRAERVLHDVLSHKRANGEWFALSPQELASLKKIARFVHGRPVRAEDLL